MPSAATIRAKVDPTLKREAELVFMRLGLTATEAIRLFYADVASRSDLPFAARVPNAETEKALAQAAADEDLIEYDSLEELKARFG